MRSWLGSLRFTQPARRLFKLLIWWNFSWKRVTNTWGEYFRYFFMIILEHQRRAWVFGLPSQAWRQLLIFLSFNWVYFYLLPLNLTVSFPQILSLKDQLIIKTNFNLSKMESFVNRRIFVGQKLAKYKG